MFQFIIKGTYDPAPEGFKQLKGHCIKELEELTLEDRKKLKKEYPQGFFRLAYWEKGGSFFEEGNAQLVCGLEGEKLLPSKIRKKGWLANDRHALFVGKNFCLVEASQQKGKVNLILKRVSIRTKVGTFIEEELWTGGRDDIENLPEDLKKFSEVLKTAVTKVLEYRCLYPMYCIPKDKKINVE